MQSELADLMQVFTEGVKARAKRLPEGHNPYPAGSLQRREWQEGWIATQDLDEDRDPCSCRITSDKDVD